MGVNLTVASNERHGLGLTLMKKIHDYLEIYKENCDTWKMTQQEFKNIFCLAKGYRVGPHLFNAINSNFGTKKRKALSFDDQIKVQDGYRRSGMSQVDYAKLIGMSPKTLSKILRRDLENVDPMAKRKRTRANDTATWYKVEESLLVCTESCVPGPAVLWDGCGSAVCGDHDNWRISGRVVGLDWNNRVHKVSYYSWKIKVVTCKPSSLDSCPENKQQYSPLVDFGEVPVILSNDNEVRDFMRKGKDMVVYVDFSNVEEPKVILKDPSILLFLYSLSSYRYLGIADYEKSKLYERSTSIGPEDRVVCFHDVPQAICVFIDKRNPFSIFLAILLVLVIVFFCTSALLVLDYIDVEMDRYKVIFLFSVSVVVGVLSTFYIKGFLQPRKRFYETDIGKNLVTYWTSSMRKSSSRSLGDYIGKIGHMIYGLEMVKKKVVTGSLLEVLTFTVQIASFNRERFFIFKDPENAINIPLPCMPVPRPNSVISNNLEPITTKMNALSSSKHEKENSCSPNGKPNVKQDFSVAIVNKNNVAQIIGSAEWSYQLTMYQLQLLCLNVDKFNYYTNLGPDEPGFQAINDLCPKAYNPLTAINIQEVEKRKVDIVSWRRDALRIVEYHIQVLEAKKAWCWYWYLCPILPYLLNKFS